MAKSSRLNEIQRFWRVIGLFISIFWSFYSLKIKKAFHRRGWIEPRRQELYVLQARRFRITAVKMGGLLIKLGQFFSARVDVFPRSVIEELEGLQDEVAAETFDDIVSVIESQFQSPLPELFTHINAEPVAAASLGQVHKGILLDGREVAIKIQRPGINNLVKTDLRALYRVVNLIKRFTDWERVVNFDAIYSEFRETVWEELDYIKEGHNAETIAKNNQENKDLLIPQIIWEYTGQRVLTMEFMQGIKISDYAALEHEGINRNHIAKLLLKAYCQMILVDGFFHADPHPGNLFVTRDSKIIMVDFGMVGTVSDQLKSQLIKMVLSVVKKDYLQVTNHLIELGFLRSDANTVLVARAMGVVLEQVLGSGKSLEGFDPQNLLDDIAELVYEQPFQIPGNITFLGRAAGTLYGLCLGLDPQISFLDEIKPYLAQFMGDKKGLLSDLWEEGKGTITALLEAPELAVRVLHRLEQGELSVRVTMLPLVEATRQNTRAINTLTLVLLLGFLLLTSTYLLINNWLHLAYIGFGVCSLVLMLLPGRMRSTRRHRPHPPVITRK